MHVGLSMLRTIPELQPKALLWDVLMLPLVTFFSLNFLGRVLTAFLNPLCRCSPLYFMCSLQRLLQLIAFGIYFAHLAVYHDERLLRWSCAWQMALIFNFGQILGTSCLLNLAPRDEVTSSQRDLMRFGWRSERLCW